MAGHDEKCELVNFMADLSRMVSLTNADIKTLMETTRPLMCACRMRRKRVGNLPIYMPEEQVLRRMHENFLLTVANKNLGVPIPGRIQMKKARGPKLKAGQEGKLIRVDFRNRRRAD